MSAGEERNKRTSEGGGRTHGSSASVPGRPKISLKTTNMSHAPHLPDEDHLATVTDVVIVLLPTSEDINIPQIQEDANGRQSGRGT